MRPCLQRAQARYRFKLRIKHRTDALYDLISQPSVVLSQNEREVLVDYIFDRLSEIPT
jgi:hypothetical protein